MEQILVTSYPKLAAKARLKFDKVRGKHLLLLPEKVVVMNETAASILILCDGSLAVHNIVGKIRDSLQAGTESIEAEPLPDLKTMEGDILEFLHEMVDQGWVVIHSHDSIEAN
ncbi:pyrroloquinoline quinone biosynthesis peptide chaperone PqqD [Neobacillus sp. PS3-34]|uniref:pyrroloquinoline quinone biosynthesis peptide chaperone PqqD n=1 Tax=Neobacillus sp. PS3-34 TaxID=3070678 RepID=UPI0027DFD954|nr:pyrroloquinoline quinone biosynthesis peptide chaperone PqqD [Neobacillus sp. PS3-34]WML50261.1 pyrroloquinoline quinone biosynthesis peptide chaperone PqqD [Neobacillus sp. PS3-34]